MSQDFYLNRTLFSDNKSYTEAELLTASNYIVILAEPGAGKTELLNNLAKQLRVKAVTANVFRYVGTNQTNTPVVIDAFDELAKIDNTGIHQLFAKALEVNPTRIILSSRSSEWDNSTTYTFEQFIGHKPVVVRLCEFDSSEQRMIYTHHTSKDSFVEFQTEVTRFSLEPLLPNPQFLKLFADAYIESEGHFPDKRSIFIKAVANLAREVNKSTKSNPLFSIDKKIDVCSEIFAKLLLSGAEGIGINEISGTRMYPLFGSLLNSNNLDVSSILATRLFKPGDNADQHRPVHKIVAEYCAADYIIKRIVSPSDPLTLEQCLPIIAPNSIVRDELRGLLGWMATLGNKVIEESLITLDSYAVLANGDPSQLEPSSKRLLLSRLKEVEVSDPYFRRGDFQRRFSIAGFFTEEVIEESKLIISNGSDGHLRDLLLELLMGAQESENLVEELHQLVLSPSERQPTRILAIKCLLELDDYDARLDLKDLIGEASISSLTIAADIIKSLGLDTFKPDEFKVFFQGCIALYPSREDCRERIIGGRYFIKRLISCLDQDLIEWLLDSLSKESSCTCGKKAFECDCRNGISKIIGSMLDRYFELAKPPFNSLRVWQWVKNLNFPNQINIQNSTSVKLLREDLVLRQEIITHVFEKLTDRKQILQTKIDKFSGCYSHAGLNLQFNDYKFIIDLSFEVDNTELWVSFMPRHLFHRGPFVKDQDNLRCHMRKQATTKPKFMCKWALINRQQKFQTKQDDRKWDAKHRRSTKRRDMKNNRIHADNIQYIRKNRELVEAGRHWSFLARFAEVSLENPENIELEFGDKEIVRNALINCHDFIESQIPNLQKLAQLQCESKGLIVETIIFASCIEIMRAKNNLEGLKPSLLVALRTNLNMGYSAIEQDEYDALKTEIDRLIFLDANSAEKFLRQYLEPQLAEPKCSYPELNLLQSDKVFSSLRSTLSIEWLGRFEDLEYFAFNTLFNIAAQCGDRDELNQIILLRCSQLLPERHKLIVSEKLEQRRKFWFVRAFYFLSLEEAEPYWANLKSDKNSILLLNERSSRMNRSDYEYWPELTSPKVETILDAFF